MVRLLRTLRGGGCLTLSDHIAPQASRRPPSLARFDVVHFARDEAIIPSPLAGEASRRPPSLARFDVVHFARDEAIIPSPLAGEGAPKGRMRGSRRPSRPLIRPFRPPSPARGEGNPALASYVIQTRTAQHQNPRVGVVSRSRHGRSHQSRRHARYDVGINQSHSQLRLHPCVRHAPAGGVARGFG